MEEALIQRFGQRSGPTAIALIARDATAEQLRDARIELLVSQIAVVKAQRPAA